MNYEIYLYSCIYLNFALEPLNWIVVLSTEIRYWFLEVIFKTSERESGVNHQEFMLESKTLSRTHDCHTPPHMVFCVFLTSHKQADCACAMFDATDVLLWEVWLYLFVFVPGFVGDVNPRGAI